MAVKVRVRDETDVAACERLAGLVHDHDRYPPRRPADPRSFIFSPDALDAWVAEGGGRIVGHIALHAGSSAEVVALASERTGRPADRLAVVAQLLVAPDQRRQGIGAALLGAATAAARTRGLWPVLDVATHFRGAIRLYEQCGWVRAGSVTVRPHGAEPLDEFVYLAPAPDEE